MAMLNNQMVFGSTSFFFPKDGLKFTKPLAALVDNPPAIC